MTEALQQDPETVEGSAITITETAAERLREEMAAHDGVQALRMLVQADGCAGLTYAMALAKDDPSDEETVVTSRGIDVYLETDALDLVRGSRILWSQGLIGGGFQVDNPNTQTSCGCGPSGCC